MAKLTPKEKMELETVTLIKKLTGFEEDEENFDICERFCLSNLLYHKFLDPDENKIRRSLTGVQQKFTIHAQPEKAKHLEDLVNKYQKQDVWNDYHEQHDIKFRLLSFLLQLSTNPINSDFSPSELSPEEEEKKNINWLELLREGEESPEPLGSESELSEWSDDESTSEKVISDNDHVRSSPDIVEDIEANKIVCDENPESWLERNVQFPYWEKRQDVIVDSDHMSAAIAHTVEKERVKQGEVELEAVKMTEYQVIREVLWMLRHPTQSPLFTITSDDRFVVSSMVTIPSLTDGAMRRVLTEVLSTINNVYSLRNFIKQVESTLNVPSTFEAYSESINILLESFSNELFSVEAKMIQQDETMTILVILDSLTPWFKLVQRFFNLHEQATKNWSERANWLKTYRLLSVFYNGIATNQLSNLHPYILDTFLRCFKVYLNIIHIWLEEGRLEDWRQEFIIYKDINEDHDDPEQFWSNAFKVHPFRDKLSAEKVEPLRLLKDLDTKIFVAGKSIEILSRLGRNIASKDQMSTDGDLFSRFLSRLKENLPGLKEVESVESQADEPLDTELQSLINSSDDQYLALAFQDIFVNAQRKTKAEAVKVDKYQPQFLLHKCQVDVLQPLESIMKRSMIPLIEGHYSRACSKLLDLFRTELKLESTLSQARKVFFMEAGDLMHDFCSQLFLTMESGDTNEIGDSASLTLLLQDCLGGRYPSWCDMFSCSYQQPPDTITASLSCLSLHLSVSWPLTIVLTQQNLDTYNKIFLFLAEVKRSLWALQSVSLADLTELEMRMEADDDLSMSCLSVNQTLSETSLCAGAKQHRLQLLRSWLIYFTSTVHGYFMSRVVHSTQLELKESLDAATDLDMILRVHQQYLQRIHDRCFLHPSVAMLKEAVTKVLVIGLELRQCVLAGGVIHSRTVIAWEEKYRNCHLFLAKTLQSMTKKRQVPHLEGLSVALLHSCPA